MMTTNLIVFTITFVFFLFAFDSVRSNRIYDRAMVQKKFPGFGIDFIVMPGQRIGYFNTPNDTLNSKIFNLYDVKRDVTFTLYTRQNPKGILLRNKKILRASTFSPEKPTKIVTHGWMSNGKTDTTISIKDAFLEKFDFNVIVMDWSNIADNVFYPIPMGATSDVGEYYGTFLNSLIESGVKHEDLHLIGHSLGAHISGFAARHIKGKKISRVTGLDPASPGFDIPSLVRDGRLAKTDAEFVDVIHTCAGYLGISKPLGHADFYPNGGGPPQPGCGGILEMIEACSHGTSWKLFAKSITQPEPLMATRCDSFDKFMKLKKCDSSDDIPMGYFTPIDSQGTYYLITNENGKFNLDDIDHNFL